MSWPFDLLREAGDGLWWLVSGLIAGAGITGTWVVRAFLTDRLHTPQRLRHIVDSYERALSDQQETHARQIAEVRRNYEALLDMERSISNERLDDRNYWRGVGVDGVQLALDQSTGSGEHGQQGQGALGGGPPDA